MIAAGPRFSFDAQHHRYELDGAVIPSVTQLIERAGLVSGQAYYTEESRRRGTEVHELCASFDLGVDLGDQLKQSEYAGYVLAYMAAVEALKPEWHSIEVPECHPGYRFGGRPDRDGLVFALPTVMELKSAAKAKHHPIQTALQAVLLAFRTGVDPYQRQRLTVYLKHSGKFSVDEHTDRRDIDAALDILRRFAC